MHIILHNEQNNKIITIISWEHTLPTGTPAGLPRPNTRRGAAGTTAPTIQGDLRTRRLHRPPGLHQARYSLGGYPPTYLGAHP